MRRFALLVPTLHPHLINVQPMSNKIKSPGLFMTFG